MHHKNNLKMHRTIPDLSFNVMVCNGELIGFVEVYVKDTLMASTAFFYKFAESTLTMFDSKP